MKTPESLSLVLCPWRFLHEARGAKYWVKIGEYGGIPTLLRFNEHTFVNPSVGFVKEFTGYFKDRILVIEEKTCEECQKELEKQINTEIVDSGCVPPKRERCVHWDSGWCYHQDGPGGCVGQDHNQCPLGKEKP